MGFISIVLEEPGVGAWPCESFRERGEFDNEEDEVLIGSELGKARLFGSGFPPAVRGCCAWTSIPIFGWPIEGGATSSRKVRE